MSILRITVFTVATATLLSFPAAAQSSRRAGKAGISYDDVVRNMGAAPVREYEVTAIEGRIDPFVGPQTGVANGSVEVRARELAVPAVEVHVAEFVNPTTGEVVRAVFDEEGALWYSTSSMATGSTATAETIAATYGEPKVVQILRQVGTVLQVFTVFAYPDRGIAFIGAPTTPPFVAGNLPTPQIPNGVPSLPASVEAPTTAMATRPRIVGEITLPPQTLPGNLDGVVLDDEDVEPAAVADPIKAAPTPVPTRKTTPKKPPVAAKKPVAGKWRSPLAATCIAGGFGPRHLNIKGASRMHLALDLRAGCGTQVKAARGGIVRHAEWKGGYGYQVEIDHGDGTSTRYSHLQKGGLKVKRGDPVDAGDVVALSGNTSSLNKMNKKPLACHLHFETLVGGKKVNPSKYIAFSRCGARSVGTKAGNSKWLRP